MAIELTTAPLSTQIGINNSLRQTFASGIPLLDGYVPNGHIYCFCNALEGNSVPDGASDTYTKTYNLSAEIPWGYFLSISNSGIWGTNSVMSDLSIRSTYFGSLTATYETDVGAPTIYSIVDGYNIGLYVTQDYTVSRRLFSSITSDRDKREDGTSFPTGTFLKTYTELGNTLIGYYGGLQNIANIQKNAKSVLKSMWLDGQNLVMSFKKFASTSGATFNEDKFCVFW